MLVSKRKRYDRLCWRCAPDLDIEDSTTVTTCWFIVSLPFDFEIDVTSSERLDISPRSALFVGDNETQTVLT